MTLRYLCIACIVAATLPASAAAASAGSAPGSGVANAPEPEGAGARPIQLASMTVRETVVFRNTTPWEVRFGVSTGNGRWQTVTVPPGHSVKQTCDGCSAFQARLTTAKDGRAVKRIDQPLRSGYVYEIYYEERHQPNFFAFRRAGGI